MTPRVRVFAPATVSNLGPGFDVLGLALPAPGDLLEAELADLPGVQMMEITGDGGVLSRDPDRNVAGRAAAEVLRRARGTDRAADGPAPRERGVRLWLHKQMPLVSGLGSSGASSAAGATAVNELLGRPLGARDVLLCAMEGERAAAGAPHADNVAPSLMGGIVLIRSYDPLEILSLPVPDDLWVVAVHPHYAVATADARTLVNERTYALDQIVPNLGNLGALVGALYRGDLRLLGRSIDDRLIEPVRARLIPGFGAVKRAALAAGALGCSISGSGPSLFALCDDGTVAERVASAMRDAFRTEAALESDQFLGKVGTEGARVVG
jgi:homoserine kinase